MVTIREYRPDDIGSAAKLISETFRLFNYLLIVLTIDKELESN
jgi:hypothetical protein